MNSSLLLCCINPSINTNDITEYTFYRLLNPYTSIKNIKLISIDGQVKAFIQVENYESASKLIKTVNNSISNCGGLQIFLSHKKYVAFDKSISKIISEAIGIKGFIIDKNSNMPLAEYNNDNSYIHQTIKNKNRGKNCWNENENTVQVNFNKLRKTNSNKINVPQLKSKNVINYYKKQFDENKSDKFNTNNKSSDISYSILDKGSATPNMLLKLHPINTIALPEAVLFNIFNCFGSINYIRFDSNDKSHTIKFENEIDILDAYYNLNNLILFGEIIKLTIINSCDKNLKMDCILNDNINKQKMVEVTKYNTSIMNKSSDLLFFISISINYRKISIEIICSIVAVIYEPVRIVELLNKHSKEIIYLVGFKSLSQALEVVGLLDGKDIHGESLNVSYSRFTLEDIK